MQCRYHAWTYGLDGRLVGAPNMREDASFDPASYGLFPVALQEWEGLIFLNLADEPGPLLEADGLGHPRLARYRIGDAQGRRDAGVRPERPTGRS